MLQSIIDAFLSDPRIHYPALSVLAASLIWLGTRFAKLTPERAAVLLSILRPGSAVFHQIAIRTYNKVDDVIDVGIQEVNKELEKLGQKPVARIEVPVVQAALEAAGVKAIPKFQVPRL